MLTADERKTIHSAEKLTTDVWKLVAKDQGCTWDEYKSVPYWIRLADFQAALERNPT